MVQRNSWRRFRMRLTSFNTKTVYEVSGPVYTNEMSKIWCGTSTDSNGQPLFAKILKYGELEDNKIAMDLLDVSKREADTLKMASSCSKNVPRLIDAWQDKNRKQYVIIMTKAPGCSLREWMEKNKKDELSPKDIFVRKCIVLQLCEIMRDITRKFPMIVHRDLKPENIYIDFNKKTKKWDVYIIDFGCANLNHMRNVGSNNYQAPEQLGVKNTRVLVSSRTDIFAIGQIFYELLIGRAPVMDQDYLRKAKETKWVQIPQVDEYLLAIKGVDQLVATIEKMTSFKIEDRPNYERLIISLKTIRIG